MKKDSGEGSIFAAEMSGSIMEIEFEDKKLQKSSKKVQVIRKSARCVDRANIVKLNQKVKATSSARKCSAASGKHSARKAALVTAKPALNDDKSSHLAEPSLMRAF